MAALARREQRSTNIWPGFVDALATLLMVIMFLLMVFVLAQFFLGEALSGRDQALKKLEVRVDELADLLALERKSNDDLRGNLAQLAQELQVSVALRDDLKGTLARVRDEQAKTRGELAQAMGVIDDNRKTIARQKSEIGLLGQDLAALKALKAELEAEIVDVAARLDNAKRSLDETRTTLGQRDKDLAERTGQLDETRAELEKKLDELGVTKADLAKRLLELAETRGELGTTRSRLGEAEAKLEKTWEELAEALKKNKLTSAELEGARTQSERRRQDIERMKLSLFDEEELSRKSRAQIALLNRQLAALKKQLGVLSGALDIAAKKAAEQKVEIKSLGKRLNAALASKVQELSRYRSEFFGRLREVLGNQAGVRIVGDRFVFQSEVLFAKGAADLGEAGRRQLDRLAETLLDLGGRMPKDVAWVLRVDGHSDSDPIATARFPSNWHLSTSRAISVVEHLIAAGLPARRLVAAGFGQYSPIAAGTSETAKARNRRIEFKLTQP